MDQGVGQIIGHWALPTARRMRCPFGNTHEVKCISISRENGRPGSMARGSRADSRWAPFWPALATRVTVPSGATSLRRANQSA
jgi:hypothetical protein